MKKETLKSESILLLVAVIWGLAFVAQRAGMEYVGPFTFNGIRFFLGALSLTPFLVALRGKTRPSVSGRMEYTRIELLKNGLFASIFLFGGISFQQVGLVYTTAGKAGFITGLYVILVPILGMILKRNRTGLNTWIGAVLAAAGMYLLSVNQDFTISFGDFLVLLCALCFAAHVMVIDDLSNRFHTADLAFIQCIACSAVSMAVALLFETITLDGVLMAAIPIIYGGVFSVGIAYTLQIYGQKNSHPSHAAIILSLESLFAALGGWMILNEIMSTRSITGCALMMAGMLISQLLRNGKRKVSAVEIEKGRGL